MKSHYIIPIFVPHKGCPHDCVFCNQKRITGQIKEVDAAFVEGEIEKYLKTIPQNGSFVEVSFFGGSFTGLPVDEQIELLKPAKKALDRGLVDAIRLSTRPDYIDDYILKTLKDYGVSIIELGVQSMDDDVLYESNRGHTVEDVYNASALIKKYGFTLGLQMMVGLPGDNLSKDIHTAEEFIKINPAMVRIYPALIIRDTYMEDMYRKGEYKPLSVDEAVNICSRLYLKFTDKGINIIRIGLQPTENINLGRDVVSGPFHPAFRELVESVLLNEILLYLCKKLDSTSICIYVNSRTISKLFADKKRYFKKTVGMVENAKVNVKIDDSVPNDAIRVDDGEHSLKMSIKDYSHII